MQFLKILKPFIHKINILVRINYFMYIKIKKFPNPSMCVCLLPATSLWGLSELWAGDVPTSDIDHSVPRLYLLLLHRLLIEPDPPYLPAVLCMSGGGIPLLPHRPSHWHVYARDYLPTRASRVSVPEYQKTFSCPPLTCHFQSPIPPPHSCPYYACLIPIATASFLLPKYILTRP